MKENMALVKSVDYGKDESSAKSLLQRHGRVTEAIYAFKTDIKRSASFATLKTKASSVHNINPESASMTLAPPRVVDSGDESEDHGGR